MLRIRQQHDSAYVISEQPGDNDEAQLRRKNQNLEKERSWDHGRVDRNVARSFERKAQSAQIAASSRAGMLCLLFPFGLWNRSFFTGNHSAINAPACEKIHRRRSREACLG